VFIEKRLRPNYDSDRGAKNFDIIEIKDVFGMLYMCAVTKSNEVDTDDLWRDDGTTGLEFCRAVMSRYRFNFLVTALRFDYINDRQLRREIDRLAQIRYVFDTFVKNCKSNYSVSE